jgi:hypothetical protein
MYPNSNQTDRNPVISTPENTATAVCESAVVEEIGLARWHDPIIDKLGFDPRSQYVERFWLGLLGPSTTLLIRRCADLLDSGGGTARVNLYDLAAQLGIGHKGGRNSPLNRTLSRACRFSMARFIGQQLFEVRFRVAPLNRAQIARLPDQLQIEHERLTNRSPVDVSVERGRARRLALSLIECGDGFDETERQLLGWQVSTEAAVDAVNWAWHRHCLSADSVLDGANSEG